MIVFPSDTYLALPQHTILVPLIKVINKTDELTVLRVTESSGCPGSIVTS